MTGARSTRSDGPGLSARVLAAMGLVVAAGAGTLVLVALLVAPEVFHRHLQDAGATPVGDLATHVDEGFATALVIAIVAGVAASVGVAIAMSVLVARRITAPVVATATAAGSLASGDYSARVPESHMGGELAALTRSVNALASRLEDQEAARQRLLADLAHELRTPLASLDATVEAIADGVLPADPATLATLTEQTRRLERLVDDVGALSRADEHAFRVEVRTVDVGDAARSAVAHVQATARSRGVEVTADVPGPVLATADHDRLVEVLGQLLDNAVRHCDPGDSVTVRCADPGVPTIVVEDTGSGFAPGDSEAIFERFRHGGAPTDDTGHGIGLTIARALVQAQGGSLTAASPGPGLGARLTITLVRAR